MHDFQRYGSMTCTQRDALVEEDLHRTFVGSFLWYYTTVKLNMEARGEFRRMPNLGPQLIDVT